MWITDAIIPTTSKNLVVDCCFPFIDIPIASQLLTIEALILSKTHVDPSKRLVKEDLVLSRLSDSTVWLFSSPTNYKIAKYLKWTWVKEESWRWCARSSFTVS